MKLFTSRYILPRVTDAKDLNGVIRDIRMLIEEQAAALLARCEKILGIELRQTRGNLRNASRAAAVWELLVIEEAADIGYVEYEPAPRR